MSTDGGKRQAQQAFIHATVGAVLQKAIRDLLPKDSETTPAELEAVTKIALMGAATLGTEDPHALFAKVPDGLVAHMASRDWEAQKNPAVRNLCQLALLEWCKRNDLLNGDWAWRWESKQTGKASFSAKVSMEEAVRRLHESLKDK